MSETITIDMTSQEGVWAITNISKQAHFMVNGVSLCGRMKSNKRLKVKQLESWDDDHEGNCDTCKRLVKLWIRRGREEKK